MNQPATAQPWLRDTFDRRLAVAMDLIGDTAAFARTLLDSDLGEGKGALRARFRRAYLLILRAKDDAQRDRYLAQSDALRRRAWDYGDGYETTFSHTRDRLLRALPRLAKAWDALPAEDRAELAAQYPAWGSHDPGTHAWLYHLPDIETQDFIDLGV